MSEDANPAYHASEPSMHGSIQIVADTPVTAALLVAAGWPAARVMGGPQADVVSAQVFAFDWRDIVAGAALDDIPLDCAILAFVSIETIDRAYALLHGFNARFVFGDAPVAIATELADLKASLTANRVHDSASEERARLQALAMELARLADQLGQITSGETESTTDSLADRSLSYQAESSADRRPIVPPDAGRIRNLIQMRRLRDRFFDSALFADPAWDMLLDLAASRLEGRSVSVSSLCIAAAVPPTTALRWIRMMTDQQLLVRRADPADARRMFIDLSDAAFDRICSWFALVDERGAIGI